MINKIKIPLLIFSALCAFTALAQTTVSVEQFLADTQPNLTDDAMNVKFSGIFTGLPKTADNYEATFNYEIKWMPADPSIVTELEQKLNHILSAKIGKQTRISMDFELNTKKPPNVPAAQREVTIRFTGVGADHLKDLNFNQSTSLGSVSLGAPVVCRTGEKPPCREVTVDVTSYIGQPAFDSVVTNKLSILQFQALALDSITVDNYLPTGPKGQVAGLLDIANAQPYQSPVLDSGTDLFVLTPAAGPTASQNIYNGYFEFYLTDVDFETQITYSLSYADNDPSGASGLIYLNSILGVQTPDALSNIGYVVTIEPAVVDVNLNPAVNPAYEFDFTFKGKISPDPTQTNQPSVSGLKVRVPISKNPDLTVANNLTEVQDPTVFDNAFISTTDQNGNFSFLVPNLKELTTYYYEVNILDPTISAPAYIRIKRQSSYQTPEFIEKPPFVRLISATSSTNGFDFTFELNDYERNIMPQKTVNYSYGKTLPLFGGVDLPVVTDGAGQFRIQLAFLEENTEYFINMKYGKTFLLAACQEKYTTGAPINFNAACNEYNIGNPYNQGPLAVGLNGQTTFQIDSINTANPDCPNASTGPGAYCLIEPIGDLYVIESNQVSKFPQELIKIFFLIITGAAVVMMIVSSIQYMGESISGKNEAKDSFGRIILGLLVALGSFALLNTIDPDLLNIKTPGGYDITVNTPVGTAPGSPLTPSSGTDFKAALIAVAQNEWTNRWGSGTRTEIEPQMQSLINDYATMGGCTNLIPTTPSWAWSAAFISFVAKQAGISSWPSSCAHVTYFANIKNNTGGMCETFPMSQKANIVPGDIVCACRGTNCNIDYNNIVPGSESHCDIVTQLTANNTVMAIGGNVGNATSGASGVTVHEKSRNLNNPDYFGFISCTGTVI